MGQAKSQFSEDELQDYQVTTIREMWIVCIILWYNHFLKQLLL